MQPSDIENLRILTLRKLSGIIHFGTNVVIYEDFKQPLNIIWSSVWERGMERRRVFTDSILNAEVTSVSIDGDYLHIGICFLN